MAGNSIQSYTTLPFTPTFALFSSLLHGDLPTWPHYCSHASLQEQKKTFTFFGLYLCSGRVWFELLPAPRRVCGAFYGVVQEKPDWFTVRCHIAAFCRVVSRPLGCHITTFARWFFYTHAFVIFALHIHTPPYHRCTRYCLLLYYSSLPVLYYS